MVKRATRNNIGTTPAPTNLCNDAKVAEATKLSSAAKKGCGGGKRKNSKTGRLKTPLNRNRKKQQAAPPNRATKAAGPRARGGV